MAWYNMYKHFLAKSDQRFGDKTSWSSCNLYASFLTQFWSQIVPLLGWNGSSLTCETGSGSGSQILLVTSSLEARQARSRNPGKCAKSIQKQKNPRPDLEIFFSWKLHLSHSSHVHLKKCEFQGDILYCHYTVKNGSWTGKSQTFYYSVTG